MVSKNAAVFSAGLRTRTGPVPGPDPPPDVLETYGSRLPAATPAIEVHEPGDVYSRDDFVYWG